MSLLGKNGHRGAWILALASLAAWQPGEVVAQGRSLADLTLEELSNLRVTSVSRREERFADAPDALYVITGEDIRRSGASNLPEALRLAPNLQVAQIDARQYAISARGFNTSTANKLLVMIDGRSVYTPLFSGVFWDSQDVLLEDVDRIEVVSGPGGTLWGTNAVNGVINIITREASASQGMLASLLAGNRGSRASLRYGGSLGESGHFRAYIKADERERTVNTARASLRDGLERLQAGFRADWKQARDELTLQGDAHRGEFEQLVQPAMATFSGMNLLSRWTRRFSEDSNLQLQAYYDRTERDHVGTFGETLDVFDVEIQHSLRLFPSHLLVWGANRRHSIDEVRNTTVLAFLPPNVRQQWTSLFAQDDYDINPQLRLTLGARLERNVYTGNEFLPSARLAWKPGERRLAWAELSRSVRAPSRIDRELFAPDRPPFLLAGGPGFRSEILNSAELGYRAQPGARLSYTAAVFHHIYDHLRSVEVSPAGVLTIGNKMEGTSTGVETWGSWQPTRTWRLSAGLTMMKQRLRLQADSTAAGTASEGNDPAHHWLLRSSLDLPGRSELDVTLRRFGALPSPPVPARVALDVRYGWKLRADIELSVAGVDLLDRAHPEFGAPATRSEIERGVYVRLIWRQ